MTPQHSNGTISGLVAGHTAVAALSRLPKGSQQPEYRRTFDSDTNAEPTTSAPLAKKQPVHTAPSLPSLCSVGHANTLSCGQRSLVVGRRSHMITPQDVAPSICGRHRTLPSLLVAISLSCDVAQEAVLAQLTALCTKDYRPSFHINCFRGGPSDLWARSEGALEHLDESCGPPLITSVPGMKGLFWKRELQPSKHLETHEFLWLVDADMHFADSSFNISEMLHQMLSSCASIAQPRIGMAHGTGWSTSFSVLRAALPFPDSCDAIPSDVVEVMVPLFHMDAWQAVHRELLSSLPDDVLFETDFGLSVSPVGSEPTTFLIALDPALAPPAFEPRCIPCDPQSITATEHSLSGFGSIWWQGTWCRLVQHHLPGRPPCALLREVLLHGDLTARAGFEDVAARIGNSIGTRDKVACVSAHCKEYVGSRKFTKKRPELALPSSLNMTIFAYYQQRWPAYYHREICWFTPITDSTVCGDDCLQTWSSHGPHSKDLIERCTEKLRNRSFPHACIASSYSRHGTYVTGVSTDRKPPPPAATTAAARAEMTDRVAEMAAKDFVKAASLDKVLQQLNGAVFVVTMPSRAAIVRGLLQELGLDMSPERSMLVPAVIGAEELSGDNIKRLVANGTFSREWVHSHDKHQPWYLNFGTGRAAVALSHLRAHNAFRTSSFSVVSAPRPLPSLRTPIHLPHTQ